ncbi:MAG: GNAT family N-acyltransferase [Spongiibacter sp.]|nr:GNAT family N-acyltransferase [Spongiibacter sp.]
MTPLRLPLRRPAAKLTADDSRFRAELASGPRDVLATQRLRYKVFASEMGAKLKGRAVRLDRDRYDKYCRHLLVRDLVTHKVVASTRILSESAARRAGGFYSAQEFELGQIHRLPGRVLEVGRTCVHPDYRSGAVIAVLWSALAELILDEGYDYVIGCASITVEGDGGNVEAIMQKVREKYMIEAAMRVQPKLGMMPVAPSLGVQRTPPLLKAYFSLGAKVCGEPCLDPDFGVADVFILLDVAEMSPRYLRHFMRNKTTGSQAGAAKGPKQVH